MGKNCSVSIVIRAYNEEPHINRLLRGILRQHMRDVEIILVDSGSTDDTVAMAKRYPVRILSISPEDFSFGRSLNIGCAKAQGEFIVIVSAHAYPVYANWLEKLIAPFSDPQVALAYGKQRGCATTKFAEHQVFRKWFPDERRVSGKDPFCNNANAAIRRELWETNPYDEALTGLEDIAWAQSLIERGHKIAYVPAAEVIHVHNESSRQIYNRYRREAIALQTIFPQQSLTFRGFVGLLLSNICRDLVQSWRAGLLFSRIFQIMSFRLMQFWGTYSGFQQLDPVTAKLRKKFYYPRRLRMTLSLTDGNGAQLRSMYSGTKADEEADE